MHKAIVFHTRLARGTGGETKRVDLGCGEKVIPVFGCITAIDGVDKKGLGGVYCQVETIGGGCPSLIVKLAAGDNHLAVADKV